ncbi:transposase family protein [Streptomyces sp. NPDC086777]|uniref:transposase family protein n=1 Tax=Streptomyces sp. NPDC086777 TaxID=3154866 RepID=UPI00344D986B
MPNNRRDQGRSHPLAFVLSLAACAVLAGAKSLAAIAERAADAPPHVLSRSVAHAGSRSAAPSPRPRPPWAVWFTTSGTSRMPRTPLAYAPAPLHVPWHPCATWPSALSD